MNEFLLEWYCMFNDCDVPQKKTEFPRALDDMSVRDLEDYRAALLAEITRVEQDKAKKAASRDAAAAFFKE